MGFDGRELRSKIESDGRLLLTLEEVHVADPAPDEVIVQVEAAPLNPSDIGLLLGPADVGTLEKASGGLSGLTFRIPEHRMRGVSSRIGQALPVGNEGAGTVVAAGADVAPLLGRRVGMIGGGMYADYRSIKGREVAPLPEGSRAADGASMFVNPLTSLGFVETARMEGHKAIIHTAAASNLGQMLQRICLADGIPLINIVRSGEQAAILRGSGAKYVIDSRDPDFVDQLTEAAAETEATLAFDAVGGGTLASQVMQAMERACVRRSTGYSRYGSAIFKHLYLYGTLDPSPTVLDRQTFGMDWSMSGWLVFPFLKKAGPEVERRMRDRILHELTTTFASRYTRTIGLAEALEPGVLRAYERKATGEKFLIDPTRG